ncbi:MAG: hypothetical protein EBX40_07200, partial [Gammaproteobacteria bacterium]|nr:hypothetical protein [Gammaproteobacteria bacterium]
MGFRQASGTKFTQLRNPVPGVDVERQMSSMPAGTKRKIPSPQASAMEPEIPEQPISSEMPEQSFEQVIQESPAAQPVQAQSGADQFSDLPSVDEYADLPSVDSAGGEMPEIDVNNFDLNIVGKKARLNNGVAEMYDEDSKEWRKPTGTEKFIAAMMLDSISNAPAIAGQIAGSAALMYGGPPGMAIGGIAGGTAAATQNERVLQELRKNPEMNKYITALEAISGESADPMG